MELLQAARNLARNKNFEEALDLYLDALKSLNSNEKEVIENEIIAVTETRLIDATDELFLRLLDCYPKNGRLLFLYGSKLLRSDKLRFASAVVQRALSFHPSNLPLLDLQQRINFKVVDRWHFRMLNDKVRNQLYYDAIARKVVNGYETVLDIGCGTGILSIFAAKNGAQQIYACDSSQAMCSIAKDSIDRNGCSQKIRLFCADSSSLRIPDHIPERVHLVVSEIFDAGLLGENCLETLEDAITRLSNPVEGLSSIIPAKARFYLMGITNEKIRNSHRAKFADKVIYDKIGDEPYDMEFLDPDEFQVLTEKMKILEINFGKLESLKKCKNFSEEIELTCIQDGVLDCIVGWFELVLDDTATLTNSPWTESCWEQAVYPSRKLVEIKKGEKVSLSVKVNRASRAKSHFMTLKLNNKSCDFRKCLFSNISVVRKLNDSTLQKYINGCLLNLKSTAGSIGNLKVLNLSNSFCSLSSDVGQLEVYRVDSSGLTDGIMITKDDAVTENLKFDVIVVDLVNESGMLAPESFQHLDFWRNHLSWNGICITRRLIVYAMPVSSEHLEVNSRVYDPVVLSERVMIGDSINKYKTQHFEEINLDSTQLVSLAAPKKALILDHEEFWTDKERTLSFRTSVAGRFIGVLYWFETRSFPSVSFNTFHSSSFQKAAFIVEPKHVKVGVTINVDVKYTPGYLLMTVLS